MWIRFVLATLGASVFIHWLKKFLGIRREFYVPDWDGILERGLIFLTFEMGSLYFLLTPLIVLVRVLFYLFTHGSFDITLHSEAGAEYQKVKMKTEMLIDLCLSPLLAIIIFVFVL